MHQTVIWPQDRVINHKKRVNFIFNKTLINLCAENENKINKNKNQYTLKCNPCLKLLLLHNFESRFRLITYRWSGLAWVANRFFFSFFSGYTHNVKLNIFFCICNSLSTCIVTVTEDQVWTQTGPIKIIPKIRRIVIRFQNS